MSTYSVLHSYSKRERGFLLAGGVALSSVPVAFLSKNYGAAMTLCGIALLIGMLADEVNGDG